MNFKDYWKQTKLPDVGNLQGYQFEALRRVAQQAFNAGRTAMRRELREQAYENKYGRLHSN